MDQQNQTVKTERGQISQPETAEYGHVPLELLLASPFCWKPPKICSFILKSPDAVIYGSESEDDPIISQIKSSAAKWNIWPVTSNWKDVLGDDFNVLQTYKGRARKVKGDLKVDTSSVLELLKLIRNKYKHSNEFTPEQKDLLGWFREISKDSERDDHLFAKYWTRKFPNLLPFLWVQFAEFRKSLREFYPSCLENYYSNEWCFGLEAFSREMSIASSHHLDQGMVEERYSVMGPDYITRNVELRLLQGDIITNALDGSSIMELVVSSGTVFIQWDRQTEDAMALQCLSSSLAKETCSFTITSSSNDVNENSILSERKIGSSDIVSAVSNFIVFATSNIVEDIARNLNSSSRFQQRDLSWCDLSERKRKSLETSTEIRLTFQGHEILLSDIFPEMGSSRLLLSELKGRKLNELLKQNKVEIFDKRQFPTEQVSASYVVRRLYERDKLHETIFQQSDDKDVFLVMNCSHDELIHLSQKYRLKILDAFDTTFTKMEFDIANKPKIILLGKDGIQSISDVLSNVDSVIFNYARIHVLKYIGGHNFHWLLTYGLGSPAEECFSKSAREVDAFNEEKFVSNTLATTREQQSIIFIGDKPGSGKSELLLNLAVQIIREANGRFVMLLTMKQFLGTIEKAAMPFISAVDIVKTMKELCCACKFEESIVENCLKNEGGAGIKFELFLDGLDEIDYDQREFALNCLQTIKNELHSVRVWVTFREHMLIEIWSKFACMGYGLDQFSREEQVEFLHKSWFHYIQADTESQVMDDVRKFALKCVQMSASEKDKFGISGSPLLLQIISEVYKKLVLSSTGNLAAVNPNYSLLDLYDTIMERKLVIFLTEKNKFYLDGDLDVRKDQSGVMRLLRKHFIKYHTYFAIQLLFGEDVAQSFHCQLLGDDDDDDVNEMERFKLELKNQGIIEEFSPLRFAHQTFAEYLVAKFVCEKLEMHLRKNDNLDSLDGELGSLFWDKVLCTNHLFSRNAPETTRFVCKFVHPTLCRFLNGMLSKSKIQIAVPLAKQLLLSYAVKIFNNSNHKYLFLKVAPLFIAANQVEFAKLFELQAMCTNQMIALFIVLLRSQDYYCAKHVLEIDEQWSGQILHKLESHEGKGYGILHFVLEGFAGYDRSSDSLEEVSLMKLIKYIVECYTSVLEKLDVNGMSPLLLLAQWILLDEQDSNVLKVFEFLVRDLKADINCADHRGNTVLHVPMSTGHAKEDSIFLQANNFAKLVEFCLQNGLHKSTLDRVNHEGHTPLTSAIHCYGHLAIVSLPYFKRYGADFNANDYEGNTVLHNALEFRPTGKLNIEMNNEFIRELVNCGADVLATNWKGQCALHLAVEAEDIHLVKFLVEISPASLRAVDYEGKTVLAYKTSNSVHEFVQLKTNFYYANTENESCT